jgi:hypothetical protein
MLMEAVSSGDRNVIKIVAKKILKYKALSMEVECIWDVKAEMILVIIWTTGTISKSFINCLSNVLGKHEMKELQKTAILGTAHIQDYS